MGIISEKNYEKLLERIPFPKQEEFLKACFSGEYDFLTYGGSVRGGKSIGLMLLLNLINNMFGDQYPRYAIIREDRPQFTTQTMPKFWEVFDKGELIQEPSSYNGFIAKFKKGLEVIFFAEGFDANFKYLEDFKGLEVDGFLFEEISGIHIKTWRKAFERVGSWKMRERQARLDKGLSIPPRIIAATCNPSPNWVKKEVYDKWASGDLPERFLYIPSTVYDNPNVSEDWIQNKRDTMLPSEFQMFINGDWNIVDNENPFYHVFFNKSSLIIHKKRREINRDYEVWVSFDFNYDPCTAKISQLIDGWGYYLYDTVQVKGGTEALCDVLIEDYGLMYFADRGMLEIAGDDNGWDNKSSGKFDYQIIADKFNLNINNFHRYSKAAKRFKYRYKLVNYFMDKIPFGMNEEGNEPMIHDLRTAIKLNDHKMTKYKNRDKGHPQDAGDALDYDIIVKFPDGKLSVDKWREEYDYLNQ